MPKSEYFLLPSQIEATSKFKVTAYIFSNTVHSVAFYEVIFLY